jgi:arginine:ornithine antiporter/lysine permease
MKAFAKSNKHSSPSFSLYLTNGIIQLFIIIGYFSASTYQAFYTLSTAMIMIPYLFSAAYYLKVTLRGTGFEDGNGGSLTAARIFALIGTIYGIWMLYSGGLDYVLITTVLYAPGLIIYYLGKRERGEKLFNHSWEAVIAVLIVIAAVVSIYLISTHVLNPF